MDEVAPQDVALRRPVAPRVERPGVARLQQDVVDVIGLEEHVVALPEDRCVRGVPYFATAEDVAAALQPDATGVCPAEDAEVMDAAVLNDRSRWREGTSVATGKTDAARAAVRYFAVGHRRVPGVAL